MNADDEITDLLQRVAQGDELAKSSLVSSIYRELRVIAASYLRNERPNHTLQPTALVNEAYLRLTQRESPFTSRTHFFSVAAQVMRHILVDYARQRSAGKRGAGIPCISLDAGLEIAADQCTLVSDLDEALTRLALIAPRQARVVELRFFAGMSEVEIAEVLGVNERTVKRDWAAARAWLYGVLEK
ncbi:MAG: sigma-70 family RNA polymerase sigma factor [Bryobacteraceae bacterium]|nr:sigma-70 family RNA polymerase sigma factor [Bryobacteraceae bacterium]